MTLTLASASPRRARLLREAGFVFEQVDPPFDDTAEDLSHENPQQTVKLLAWRKAISASENIAEGVVLGADTVLNLDGRLIGKPADVDEARAVLNELIGRVHEVITGVCLLDVETGEQDMFADHAKVKIGKLTEDVLESYLAGEAWRGKAGGYNLAELEDTWPFEIAGDRTTIIGLPMQRLIEALEDYSIHPSPTS